jgi:hypothetical protein
MNDHDDSLQVKDNRLFNADGTLREGVSRDPEPTPTVQAEGNPATKVLLQDAEPLKGDDDKTGYKAQNKIDFQTFTMSLASSVQISLGLVAHPMTGQVEKDLTHAQQTIDILGLLEAKTEGNLTPEESGMLRQVLFQLRMAYVELSKRP